MDNKPEIIVLYIDREDNSLHQILLNSLELNKISAEITNIFNAKKSDVMVSDTKLRLYKEVEKSGKANSRKVQ
ncbi:MAG: hypothetical protein ACI3T9_00955 [Romboutsia timonensis]